MAMEILADTPTSEYVAPTSNPEFPSSGNGVRRIDVDLTNQRVYAYEGDVIVNSFIVSTGTARTPTVTGKFKVYIKLVPEVCAVPVIFFRTSRISCIFIKAMDCMAPTGIIILEPR